MARRKIGVLERFALLEVGETSLVVLPRVLERIVSPDPASESEETNVAVVLGIGSNMGVIGSIKFLAVEDSRLLNDGSPFKPVTGTPCQCIEQRRKESPLP